MSGSLTRGSGENVAGILGACATRNFTYLVRGSWMRMFVASLNSNTYQQRCQHSNFRQRADAMMHILYSYDMGPGWKIHSYSLFSNTLSFKANINAFGELCLTEVQGRHQHEWKNKTKKRKTFCYLIYIYILIHRFCCTIKFIPD